MRIMGHKTMAMTQRYIAIAESFQARHQERAMDGVFPSEMEGLPQTQETDAEIVIVKGKKGKGSWKKADDSVRCHRPRCCLA